MSEQAHNLPRSVLIAAGGTGGHVFPALAVAELLREQSVSVHWLGTMRGIEFRRVPEKGIDLHTIRVAGVRGKNIWAWIKAPFLVLAAVFSVLQLIRKHHVGMVLGMGGYVSVAAGLAAVLARKPLVIQEQNAVAGSTNRLLAPFASRIFTGFEGVFAGRKQAVWSGNPLRDEFSRGISGFAESTSADSVCLLVIGGSLGAAALNEQVPAAVSELVQSGKLKKRLHVVHQTGSTNKGEVEAVYKKADVEADVVEFIEDVCGAYLEADLIVARSGALTVSEIAAVGRAAIFIPYPHAIDDHQTANASYLVDVGAALLIPQDELQASNLATTFAQLLGDSTRLKDMAQRAGKLGQREAASVVASACSEYLYG